MKVQLFSIDSTESRTCFLGDRGDPKWMLFLILVTSRLGLDRKMGQNKQRRHARCDVEGIHRHTIHRGMNLERRLMAVRSV